MKVKVCGITNLQDALICEQSGADMLGFIFYNKSKRYINFEFAENIIKRLSAKTIKVGVFVNETAVAINNAAEKLRLNYVQLHGDEPAGLLEQIQFPVIKSFRITENFDYSVLNSYSHAIPLLDTFSDNLYGGTGCTFDWEKIPPGIRNNVILAGGISVFNIQDVIMHIMPYAVDLSSSLESEPGRKEPSKVADFFTVINKIQDMNRK